MRVIPVIDALSDSQVEILRALRGSDYSDMYGAEIADEADISVQTVYRHIDTLVDQGLLLNRAANLDRSNKALIEVYRLTDFARDLLSVLDESDSVDIGSVPDSEAELVAYERIAANRRQAINQWEKRLSEIREQGGGDDAV